MWTVIPFFVICILEKNATKEEFRKQKKKWINNRVCTVYLFKCLLVTICISNSHVPQLFRMKNSYNLLVTHFIKSSLKFFINCLYRDVEDIINTLRNIVVPLIKKFVTVITKVTICKLLLSCAMIFHRLSNLIFITFWGRCSYYEHFTAKETESQWS